MKKLREEAEIWLRQGERDLKTARNSHDSGDYYASVFFSHQAAEKALKAGHIERKRERPKTHNLVRLADELDAGEDLLSELRDLSPEYTITRYPDAAGGPIDELYDESKSQYSLKTSKEVLKWIKSLLER